VSRSIVCVTWHDAHSEDGWQEIDEINNEPCVVRTVGYLIDNSKAGHVVIAQSLIEGTDTIDAVLYIPVAMVVAIRVMCS